MIMPTTTLSDAAKCILVSFDSTMRSNLSVGMPIDLVCYQRDSLEIRMRAPLRRGRCLFHGTASRLERGRTQRVPGAARAGMVVVPASSGPVSGTPKIGKSDRLVGRRKSRHPSTCRLEKFARDVRIEIHTDHS